MKRHSGRQRKFFDFEKKKNERNKRNERTNEHKKSVRYKKQ